MESALLPGKRTSPAQRALAQQCGLLLLAGLLASCRPADPVIPALSDQELARVGSQTISVESFLNERTRARPSESNPELLERLIERELLYAEALRSGFAQSPEVQAAWKQWLSQRYREVLESQDTPTPPSETEIRAEYTAHPERYSTVRQIRVALIRLPVGLPPERTQAIIEAAQRTAGESVHFGTLAAQSTHPASRGQGGDLGWLTESQAVLAFPPEVATALMALKHPGEISRPVATAEGLHLLKLMESRPEQPKPYEAVRDAIAFTLQRHKRQSAEQQRFAQLRSRHPISRNPERLAEIESEPPPVAVRPPRLP